MLEKAPECIVKDYSVGDLVVWLENPLSLCGGNPSVIGVFLSKQTKGLYRILTKWGINYALASDLRPLK